MTFEETVGHVLTEAGYTVVAGSGVGGIPRGRKLLQKSNGVLSISGLFDALDDSDFSDTLSALRPYGRQLSADVFVEGLRDGCDEAVTGECLLRCRCP